MNNIIKLLKVTKYVLYSTLRNPSALFFGFFFPFIFIIAFGLISNGASTFSIGILSTSIKSGPVYDALQKVGAVKLITDKTDEELTTQLKKGQMPAVLEIVENKVNVGGQEVSTYTINLQTTSAAPTDSATVTSIISGITNGINNEVNKNQFKLVDFPTPKNIEGRKYQSIDFILPGQLSFALLSTGVFNVAFALITLRKTLVLKRMDATPSPRWIFLAAKVLSSLIIGIMQVTLIIGVGHFVFNFTLIDGLWTFIAMLLVSMVGLLVFLGLGLLVSSLGDNEDSISPIANLVTLPQFILSGAFFPISAFPAFLQPIARIMPMTFLNDSMRKIAFEGAAFSEILPNIVALFVIGVIIYAVTIRIFKWE